MKTSEFQFNDWVKYGCGDPQFCAHQIKGLKENIIFFDDYTATSWFSAENAYPIPLTEEILKKNGFALIEVGDDGVLTPSNYRNRFEKWEKKTKWRDVVVFYDRLVKKWRMNGLNINISDVHIFQHALRMLELEELADNFQI